MVGYLAAMLAYFSILLGCFVHVLAAPSTTRNETLPFYMTPCPQSMPPDEFNLCVTNMARTAFPYHIQGDPTRGVPPLDPLPVIRLDLEIRNPPLKVTVLDGVMVGLKDLDIQASRTDLKTEYSEYDLKIPRLNLLGNYQADGFFLFMAVNDKGPINITIVDLDLTVTTKFSKKVKKDKVLHMKLKDVSFKVNSIGRAYYYMGNLFQGALPLLNDQFNQALNADWKAVTNEALPSLSKAFSKMFKSVVGRIMQPYPFNALFPPQMAALAELQTLH